MKLHIMQFSKYSISFSHKSLICTVPKPSLLSFLNVTDQVSHPQL